MARSRRHLFVCVFFACFPFRLLPVCLSVQHQRASYLFRDTCQVKFCPPSWIRPAKTTFCSATTTIENKRHSHYCTMRNIAKKVLLSRPSDLDCCLLFSSRPIDRVWKRDAERVAESDPAEHDIWFGFLSASKTNIGPWETTTTQ